MVLSDLDRDLLARCLQGTDGAWEDFVDRYLPLITHVVNSTANARMGSLPDEMRADLTAEILLGLVDKDFAILRRFRGQSSLGTYLVVVSRRIAVRKLAKMRRVPKQAEAKSAATLAQATTSVTDERLSTPASLLSPEAWHMENVEEVDNLLAHMPSEEATAIRMFHLEHRSYSDIGTHFGIPENSVGPLLSRARDRMRGMRPNA